MRNLLAALSLFVALSFGTTITQPFLSFPAPVAAQTVIGLGGLDLEGYCDYMYQVESTFLYQVYVDLVLVEDNAWGWRCKEFVWEADVERETVTYWDIDMNAACQWQYGYPDAWAAEGDFNDPYSWWCYRYPDGEGPWVKLGPGQ